MNYVLQPEESHKFLCESLPISPESPRAERDADISDAQPPQLTPLEIQEPEIDYSSSDKFPEGGRRAWATVFGSFCMYFITFGAIYSFGVFQDFYTRIYLNKFTPSQISWIGSCQVFLVFFLGLPTGKLFDEGYMRPLMWTGSALYVLSMFLLSLAKPNHYYQIFLSQGLCAGLGMGLIYVPSTSICFHYFKRRRALAIGTVSLGGATGAITQTIALNQFLNGRVGFAWGVRIFAFIFLGLMFVANSLMRPRLPPRKLRRDNLPKPNIKKVVTDIPFLITILGSSMLIFAIYFPLFYVQLFAVLHGISTRLAFYSITILNGATIVGRLIMGVLADRYGALNTVIGGSTLLGIAGFSMIKATSPQGLVVFAVFYGIFSGGCISLGGPTVSVYVDNISDLGFAFGYSAFVQSFFLLVAAPIAGQILDAPNYRWNATTIVLSSFIFIGVCCLVSSRALLMKRKKVWLI